MGNASTKEQTQAQEEAPEEFVDGGYLVTQGVYTGPQDFKKSVVRHLQLSRRLPPFYKGLEDFDETWTDQELATKVTAQIPKPPPAFDPQIYKNASECPICFLFYPPHTCLTKCCHQPICTECFVQIRRPNPHVPIQHADSPDPPPENPEELIMEPANCPYCVTPDFGVSYCKGEIITTDRIRPDWSIKLQKARDKAFRRAQNAALLNAHLLASARRESRRIANNTEGRSTRREPREQPRRRIEEDDALLEAIRLSLLEEEERKRKAAAGTSTTGERGEVVQDVMRRSGSGIVKDLGNLEIRESRVD